MTKVLTLLSLMATVFTTSQAHAAKRLLEQKFWHEMQNNPSAVLSHCAEPTIMFVGLMAVNSVPGASSAVTILAQLQNPNFSLANTPSQMTEFLNSDSKKINAFNAAMLTAINASGFAGLVAGYAANPDIDNAALLVSIIYSPTFTLINDSIRRYPVCVKFLDSKN